MKLGNDNLQTWRRGFIRRRKHCGGRTTGIALTLLGVVLAGSVSVQAGPLLEEAFAYPAGTSLAANLPWAGNAGGSLQVQAGSLTLPNLQALVPAGNQVQIAGGTAADAYRSFAPVDVTAGAVYCSFLVQCSLLPTNTQFTIGLLGAGATTAHAPDDALDFYVRPRSGGYGFSIRSGGSDSASTGSTLALNTTHFIVLKYFAGQASLYVDPARGGAEPVSPDASTSSDDDGGPVASSLGTVLFHAASSAGQGAWFVDTLRVGANWADVTPMLTPLSVSGPGDQAVCSGDPAIFTVTAIGTPPFLYNWRTNGVTVPDATNSEYVISAPKPADAAMVYDVVVQDSYGAVTSGVARLQISVNPASIAVPPADPIVTSASTNAVFTVTAGGDAPLTYQWRTNGVAVAGATNSAYVVLNPVTADPGIAYDVVVANPCGVVTSSPPAHLQFPHVFYAAFDAGPGFFSGENLLLTNTAGLTLQSWSAAALTLPVTNWNLEGALQEQPLNDGSGLSIYSINVTPATSPAYYIFGSSITPPYLTPIPVLSVATDPGGFYVLTRSDMAISAAGLLTGLDNPVLLGRGAGAGLELTSTAVPGKTYYLQVCTNLQPPLVWLTTQTNVADASGVVRFTETNPPGRFFRLTGQ